MSKAEDLEESIKDNIEQAIARRCDCNFESSAIYSGEFSCQTTTNEVVYRAIVNGSSELLTANELVSHIEEWKTSEGTLLYNKFRLRLAQACSLRVESFNEPECDGDGKEIENGRHGGRDNGDGLLLGSKSCYRFQTCDDSANSNGSGSDNIFVENEDY